MKDSSRLLFLSLTVLIGAGDVFSQDDETRQATGLPMVIGENVARGNLMNVSGRVSLEGVEKLKRVPTITVVVLVTGATGGRSIANDTGYYLIRNVPREQVTLLVEVDGLEVIRQPIQASAMGNPRFDFTVPWPPAASLIAKPGLISANPLIVRTEKNEELFQKAVTASRTKETKKASELFNQVLTNDPKDFVAWTELGTVFFKENSLDNAEACYFKAIELKKDYFVALLNLGKLYVSRKQFDNAVLVLSNAVKSGPASAGAHHHLGEAYLQIRKGSAAVVHFNEAIRLSPLEKADIHLRLATLYDAAGMKGKAADEYRAFLTKRPEYADKKQLEKYIWDNPPK